MATNVQTLAVQNEQQLEQYITSYIAQGYQLANRTQQQTTLIKRKEFSIFWLVIGLILCVLPLFIYLIIYATQSDQMVVLNLVPPQGAGYPLPQMTSLNPGPQSTPYPGLQAPQAQYPQSMPYPGAQSVPMQYPPSTPYPGAQSVPVQYPPSTPYPGAQSVPVQYPQSAPYSHPASSPYQYPTPPSMPQAIPPTAPRSPDGKYWWDGQQWQPIVAPPSPNPYQ